jgi:hypothetical protein
MLQNSAISLVGLPALGSDAVECYRDMTLSRRRNVTTPEAVMANSKKPASTYHVDGRVSIALDALDEKQKKAVGRVIRDRDHFLAYAAGCGKVERISKKRSVYALSVPTDLSIIYQKLGDDIEVLDLMGQAILRRYRAKGKSGATDSRRKSKTRRSTERATRS